MTTPTTTQTVTAAVTLLYGTPGSGTTPLLIVNLDAATTVYVSNQSTVTVGGANSVPLPPGASLSFDGSTSVYAVTPGPKVQVAIVPGGSQYFLPASLANIGGSKVYVQAGTPAGNIPVNSVWFDTSNRSLQTWNGTAWVNQAFNAQNLIQAATILGTQIASQSVTAGNIANGTLTTAQIAAAAGILGTQIAAATITGANIAANTITAANIAANTITASQLAAGIVYAGIVNGTEIDAATFKGTNWLENPSGQFLYSGTPGAADLTAWLVPVATSDPFGTSLPGGIGTQDPATGNSVHMTGYALNLADTAGNNWAVTTVTPVPGGTPYLAFHAPAAAGLAVAYVDGAGNLVANEPGASLTPEAWHAPPAPSGWAAGDSGRTAIRFMREPNNKVTLDIDMVATASAAAGSNLTLCTLPAGWAPSVPHRGVVYMGAAADHTAALLQCQTDGTVLVDAIPAVTTSTRLAGIVTVPLD